MSSPADRSSSFGRGHYLLAAAPFVVVFLIMPCELFFTQAEEWDLAVSQLLMLPALGALGMLVAWALLFGIACRRPSVARLIAIVLFMLGCFLLLADLYSPVQMDSLAGENLSSDEPFKYTLLEIAIGVVLLGILALIWRGRGERIAVVFAGLLAFVGLAYGGVVLAYLLAPEPEITQADANTEAGSGNVYHIVLDRMQTDAFLEAVERADARDAFDGFELFTNNVSNYLITAPSRASYLSGTFYHEGRYKDWHKGIWREQGIQKLLADQGYRVWNYVPFRQWQDPTVDVFHYALDIYHDHTGIPGSGFGDFITLWLLRPVPNPLTNEALPPIGSLRDRLLAVWDRMAGTQAPSGERPKRLTVREGVQVVASRHMFDQATLDEDRRAGSGEYVYFHAVMPHLPYVFEENCDYYSPPPRKLEDAERRVAYLKQSVCSVRLIADFLNRLRALDRYDNATILLHADTGAEEGFVTEPPDHRSASMTLGRSDDRLLSGVDALLMIKRPHGRGPLREIDRATQLVDLFPSLADILGLEDTLDAPIHGRSIYAEEKAPREVRFSFDPNELLGDDFVEVRIEKPEDFRHSPLTVIGSPLEPALWRDEIKMLAD